MSLAGESKAGLDHVVIAAHDLDALGALYAHLGFQVGDTNRHPWGTENKIIQLSGQFIELISISSDFSASDLANNAKPFAGFLARFLSRRQGAAMLARSTDDARALHADWQAAGLGLPGMLDFERAAVGAAGASVRVAFSLTFGDLQDDGEAVGIFACQHHEPQNFWFADRQKHTNCARVISKTVFVSQSPDELGAKLARLHGVTAVEQADGNVSWIAPLCDTTLEVISPAVADERYGAQVETSGIIALHIATDGLERIEACLAAGAIPHECRHDGSIVLSPETAMGTALVFEASEVVSEPSSR